MRYWCTFWDMLESQHFQSKGWIQEETEEKTTEESRGQEQRPVLKGLCPAEWERGQVRGGGRTPETMQMEQHGRILKRELSKKINNRREETRSTTQLCLYTFCKNTYRGIHIKHNTRIYEKQYNMMVKSTNSSSMCI